MWNAAEWKCSVKCVLTDAEEAQHVLPHRSAAMLAVHVLVHVLVRDILYTAA